MTRFEQLVLMGIATIIRSLLRDYRDDGKDAIELAEEIEQCVDKDEAEKKP